MSEPKPASPAKLVIGLLMKEKELFAPAAADLTDRFGPVDIISNWFSFDYTSYYEPEMGRPLYRRMIAFKNLIPQEDLAAIKLETNRLEQKYAAGTARRMNIDPGYLLLPRFVLATGKNFAHRIYVGQGIYADLTLIFTKGGFQTLPWTYPDYADTQIQTLLEKIRKKYSVDLKQLKK